MPLLVLLQTLWAIPAYANIELWPTELRPLILWSRGCENIGGGNKSSVYEGTLSTEIKFSIFEGPVKGRSNGSAVRMTFA